MKKKVELGEGENISAGIEELRIGHLRAWVLGTTPLIMHRYSTKAKRELMLGKEETNKAARKANLKHDPMHEYRESFYLNRDQDEPAAFHMPNGVFIKAMAEATLAMPGAKKAEILRLVSITSPNINVYGIPELGMDMVRSSGIARTPDVRTRPYFPAWACMVELSYVEAMIGPAQVVNLLNAAGLIMGAGDWRPQKGGSYGRFKIVAEDDRELREVLKQGRKVQMLAFETPQFFNQDTEELYSWYLDETKRREKVVPSLQDSKPRKARKAPTARKVPSRRNSNGGLSVRA